MSKSKWRYQSLLAINKGLLAAKEAGIIESIYQISNLKDEDKKELKKIIEAKYPFGQRAYYPYQVWRQTLKEVLNYRSQPQKETNTQQLNLFE